MNPPAPADDRHLDLLALFYIIAAILAGLSGLALLSLGLGAAVTASTAHEIDAAARFAAVLFLVVALMLFAFGGACASTGLGLLRRRTWSRPAALVLALVSLVIVPFGTAVGIYAFWVLLRQRARELLGAA